MARRPACSSSTSSSSPSASSPPPAAAGVEFVADRGDHGARLDRAVQRHGASRGLSRARIQRLVADGRVTVNGQRAARAAARVHDGDVVRVAVAAPTRRREVVAEALPLDVVHDDADLLVVVKPPGQLVHPTARRRSGTLLNAVLGRARAEGGWQPHLLQRLDAGTSGLLVVAKSREALRTLQRLPVTKDYLALVWGRPTPARGRIETHLRPDPLHRRRMMVSGDGALAATEYRTLGRGRAGARGVSLLVCRLLTGRTHQLRVHLADRGWPLVGEPVYRVRTSIRLPDPRQHRAAVTFGRQALHAWQLSFPHPATGTLLRFSAPVPADLAGLLEGLGLTARGDEPRLIEPSSRSGRPRLRQDRLR
ncbi:MAG: RluA family pseudouridine synthase [Vicinamibacterales bacterium]